MSKIIMLIGSVMGGVGTILSVAGIVNGLNTRSFVSQAIPAQGTVVNLIRRFSTDSDGEVSELYYPMVRFTTKSGQERIFESNTGSYPPRFSLGQQVEVLYNSQNPNSVNINSFFSLWGVTFVLTALGSVFLVIGGCLIIIPLTKKGLFTQAKYQK
ncbi:MULTISPECIES: DUF3592 domain-containing protein [Nostocales]|nr:DUF3592 domain-containing protein [Tolypothrix bouteillei]